MTPKEKAIEIVDKYNELLSVHVFNGTYDIAQQCALIAVDELIKSWDKDLYENCGASEYWQEVKQEIEKL
jgi:hypothetical protein